MRTLPFDHARVLAAAAMLAAAGCAAGTDETDGGADGPPSDDSPSVFDTGVRDSGADAAAPPDTGNQPDVLHLPDGGGKDHAADTGPGDASDAKHIDGGGPPDAGKPDSHAGDTGPDSPSTCVTSGFTGALATYDLTGEPGDEATAPATSTGGGVAALDISRASGITPVAGTDSINGSNWGTGSSADPTRYYTFTLTPAAGCKLTLSSVALDVRASSTGPSRGDVATSADAFSTHSTSFAGTSTPTTALSASGTGSLEVRVYGYGATSSGGTFRIRNTLTVSGSIL